MKKPAEIERILLSEARIRRGVRKLAGRISADYAGKDLTLVCVLKGSVVFLADLIRALRIPCAIDFMSVASYEGKTESSGVVRLLLDLRESPTGKHVLLVEDILDTGLTLRYLSENLRTRGVASLRTCTLLDKWENRRVPIRADYVGFKIPNRFVVGYGLDYAERHRQLPYIGVLKSSAQGRNLP